MQWLNICVLGIFLQGVFIRVTLVEVTYLKIQATLEEALWIASHFKNIKAQKQRKSPV